ncbi:hypothetical protein PTSG_11869 [Salpingoeca rosetta]|uniref:Sister chromatid cohesion protein n=1 Tax=Salpingoeca rosetta (strain ATCC 50818 / BSB-021) TaxID=946362 RepID=F2U1W0_SALR5|nr:uncharacterized protein PTSG_11869 [Salpingoeca rosetta]EGD81612.1 hypothetical protein PTSG_11869 [Salpingoeca rosetta]|eukprot:XP_004996816.1 hypothetical protein PTSG_11869 [Salpingoeca rosetta]
MEFEADPLLLESTPDKKRPKKVAAIPQQAQQTQQHQTQHQAQQQGAWPLDRQFPQSPVHHHAVKHSTASATHAATPPQHQVHDSSHSHHDGSLQASESAPASPTQPADSPADDHDDILEKPQFQRLSQLIDQAIKTFEGEQKPALATTTKLMKHLTTEFEDPDKLDKLHTIDSELLVKLLVFAQQLMRPGLKIALNKANDGLDEVLAAANAAKFAMSVMVVPRMPKQVLLEDLIENCAQFIKHHLSKHIYPFCNTDDTTKGDGRRRRASVMQGLGKRRKLYQHLTPLVHVCTKLVGCQPLNDQIIIDLSRFSVEAVFIDGLSDLKLEAVALCSMVFQRKPRHRETILQEIFSNLSKLTVAKRRLRTFEVRDGVNIQVFTLLIMQLLQAVCNANLEDVQRDDSAAMFEAVLSTTKEVSGLIKDVVVHFSSKIEQGKSDIPYATMFTNFVQDVCACAFQPKWPVACDIMMAVVSRMNGILRSSQASSSLRQLAFDCLMTVLSTYAQGVRATKVISEDTLQATQDAIDHWRAFENYEMILTENALLTAYVEAKLPVEMTYFIVRIMGRELIASKAATSSAQASADQEMLESQEPDEGLIRQRQHHQRCDFLWKFLASPTNTPVDCHATCGADILLAQLQTAWYQQRWATSLNIIVSKRQDPMPTVRTKAIKSLATLLVDDTPKIVQLASEAIKSHSMDVSSSVREAVVELLTSLLVVHPQSLDDFFGTIETSLQDKSVAVRKRTIRLVTDMIGKEKRKREHAVVQGDLCQLLFSLSRRMQDDETLVKDLACKPFLELWFQPDTDVADVVESMRKVFVLLSDKVNGSEYMQALFQLAFKQDKKITAQNGMAQDIAADLADNLNKTEHTSTLVQLANTLCQACPSLFVQHVQPIVLYLSGLIEAKKQMDVLPVVAALNLLCSCVPLCPRLSDALLVKLERTLGRMMFSGPGRALQPSAACLRASTTHSNNIQLPRDLVQTAYERLRLIAGESATRGSSRRDAPRCLIICGVLCRYFDLDEDDLDDRSPDRELLDDRIADVVYKMLLQFAALHDVGVVEAAITAFGHFFVQHASLILRKESVELLRTHLTSDAERIRIRTLEALHLFLTEEERQLEHQSKHAHKGELAQFGGGESGVSATLIAALELLVHENATHESPQVRRATLQLLVVVQRRGLVNPMNFVDVLVAATSDGLAAGVVSQTSVQAKKLLEELATRRYEFLTSRGRDAITGVYTAQRKLQRHTASTVRGYVGHQSTKHALLKGLFNLYKRRQDRRQFVSGLVDASFQKNAVKADWQLSLFAVDNLATLEYQHMDEVATVVSKIDSLTSTRATKLVMDVASSLGLEVHDDFDAMSVDELAGRVHGGNELAFRSLMESQQILELMLLVKMFLMRKYNVHESDLKTRTETRARALRPIGLMWNPECCGVTQNYAQLEIRDLMAQYLLFRKLEEEGEQHPDFAPVDDSISPMRRTASGRARAFSRQGSRASRLNSRRSLASAEEDESDDDDDDEGHQLQSKRAKMAAASSTPKSRSTSSSSASATHKGRAGRKASTSKPKRRRSRRALTGAGLGDDDNLQDDPDDNEDDDDWVPGA